MDEVTEAYCWHNYELPVPAGDRALYQNLLELYRHTTKAIREFCADEDLSPQDSNGIIEFDPDE